MSQKMPIVELDVPARTGWNWFVTVLVALALAVCGAWWFAAPVDLPAPARLSVLLLALAATLIAWSARQRESCLLRWDGEQWFVASARSPAMMPGRVDVMVDLQFAMLLRFSGGEGRLARVCWIAVDRGAQRAQWHVLRCAAHRRAGREADAGGMRHLEARE